jgi:hypothetical protein
LLPGHVLSKHDVRMGGGSISLKRHCNHEQ